ncbi:GGDEF domain-containing protein [Campylobacter sp. RM12642]|uniref:GGDEF domain-containing protein n=1 Tax=unclassified Campylobacter TaxID=2593542 RepID=UPI001DF1E4D1|nr:GGDEF domain-containing protein [Campylobacter sp. RM12642]MBZ8006872.1 GGDEF domain-containing protein [Campylobacter sp. RM9334]
MKEIRRVDNFEYIIKVTVVIIGLVHLIYTISFTLTGLYFLLPSSIIQILISLIVAYIVLVKNKGHAIATIYAHLDILFSCCYCTYYLGWGYGFTMIIVLLLSLAYLQNFNTFLVPIGIGLVEATAFFVMLYITKDTPNYPNPFMPYINIANFLFMVVTLLVYIWLNDRENAKIIKQLDDRKEFLQYKAENDYLTTLLNRRAMNEILDNVLEKLKNKEINSLAVAIGDIDNFKHLNDTYGHNFGDLALKEVARVFKNEYENNENTYVARWGGEEFLILFSNYSYNDSLHSLEKSRKLIEKLQIKDELNKTSVTISIGMSYSINLINKDVLITKADAALYNAKDSGKNRVKSVNLG